MLWFLVVIPLIVSSIHGTGVIHGKTICVRPTDPPHTHCDCPSQTDCRTLNEWISVDSNPFTNNTTVVLLEGVHLINSTMNESSIVNVHSLVLVGKKNKGATVTCVQNFSFQFNNCNNINISAIEFNSCALLFSNILNGTRLSGLTMINSRLTIAQKSRYDLEVESWRTMV